MTNEEIDSVHQDFQLCRDRLDHAMGAMLHDKRFVRVRAKAGAIYRECGMAMESVRLVAELPVDDDETQDS